MAPQHRRKWSSWVRVLVFVAVVMLGWTLWGWSADETNVGSDRPGQVGPPAEPGVPNASGIGASPRDLLVGLDGQPTDRTVRSGDGACSVGQTAGGPRPTIAHVGIWNDRVTVFELDERACPRPVEITTRRAGELPEFQRVELQRGIPFQTEEEKYLILEGLETHG